MPGVRTLDADDLGIGVKAAAAASHASSSPDAPDIPADHPMIREIIRLAEIYGGVILSGRLARRSLFSRPRPRQVMTGAATSALRFVQFHASYQYEDFMLGFTPEGRGRFTSRKGRSSSSSRTLRPIRTTPTSWSLTSYRAPTSAASSARR